MHYLSAVDSVSSKMPLPAQLTCCAHNASNYRTGYACVQAFHFIIEEGAYVVGKLQLVTGASDGATPGPWWLTTCMRAQVFSTTSFFLSLTWACVAQP